MEIRKRAFATFVKFCPPSKTGGSSTLFGWLKAIHMKSGVDTGTFKANSNRSILTSKAGLQRAVIGDILKQRWWSN